MLRSG
jgi:actin-related protein 2